MKYEKLRDIPDDYWNDDTLYYGPCSLSVDPTEWRNLLLPDTHKLQAEFSAEERLLPSDYWIG